MNLNDQTISVTCFSHLCLPLAIEIQSIRPAARGRINQIRIGSELRSAVG